MTSKFKALLGNPAQHDPDSTVEDFMEDLEQHINKIPVEAQAELEADVQLAELDQVVSKAHTDSAPGKSGISYALIKEMRYGL